MKHLFLDTNILIDLLSGRVPFGADAVALFTAAHTHQIRLYASGISISTVTTLLSGTIHTSTAGRCWFNCCRS